MNGNISAQLGDKGDKVKLIQEWLCLRGLLVKIDGEFGPATDSAVRRFQHSHGLPADGTVGAATFDEMIRPMTRAMASIQVASGVTELGTLITAYAQQHLEQSPREVGGQNRGPWVRLYMEGNEGNEWAWCAGFAIYIAKQACQSLGLPLPIEPSFSCDELARRADRAGLLVSDIDAQKQGALKRGSLFLVRKSSSDWVHAGIVTEVGEGSFDTIEGNTNDEGSREGYEVCARVREFKDMDFIVWK